MGIRPVWGALLLLLGASVALGQEAANRADLLLQAEALVSRSPTAVRWVGLAEMHRAAGQYAAARENLAQIAKSADAKDFADLICWRMLRPDPAKLDDLRRAAKGGWQAVVELYLVSLGQDRQGLLTAAAAVGDHFPERFPTVAAEQAHIDLLKELGLSPAEAGLAVIAHRSYDALHALRDLDRNLTREADFLRSAGRTDDAKTLTAVRDRLRLAYLAASRHLVERLFALTLLERTQERDALLAQAKAVPYLADPKALAALLGRLDEEQAWTLLIRPLLDSEVALVVSPPDLENAKAKELAALNVQAAKKSEQGELTRYDGDVKLAFGRYRVTCATLAVIRGPGEPPALTLVGGGKVVVSGVPGYPDGLRADRFTFASDLGRFSFGGDVRLLGVGTTLKLRACTLTPNGEVGDRRSLLDDFRAAPSDAANRELLPKIARLYADDELPADVRYWSALELVRPHLTWHAAYPPPRRDQVLLEAVAKTEQMKQGEDLVQLSAWGEAHAGEDWLLDPASRAQVQESLRKAHAERDSRRDQRDARTKERDAGYFWRIKDPQHADVARAVRLLEGAAGHAPAAAWLQEIRRNNTILTFDVSGGYAPSKDAPIIVDVRNADKIAFKLYRTRDPETLLRVTDRIGADFLFRDHGLQEPGRSRDRLKHAQQELLAHAKAAAAALKPVVLDARDLVSQWENAVADLKALGRDRGEQGRRDDHDGDADFFDDRCERFTERIEKTYRPDDLALSSWRCERVVHVPGKALKEAGAYILVAEANGQIVYVPLLVDPLSLTLGRCRDGVFALVSNRDGEKPVIGASVAGLGQLGAAVTDAGGATFVRMFAAGDRAVVAYKDGRFAVGGFGDVFEGLYHSVDDPDAFEEPRRHGGAAAVPVAQVYSDRHVVAAYTDRPTYRPGQEVQFKLIVRRLAPTDAKAQPSPGSFRDDLDAPTKLNLPENGTEVRYELVDSKGRAVGGGAAKLNDFGTAVGQVRLNAEAATGSYALRVHLAGAARVVPEVLTVKYYRRPDFELTLAGVPAKLKEPGDISLDLTGRYYFGKPVAEARASVRLLHPNYRRPLATADGRTDGDGKLHLALKLPPHLDGGQYFVVADLTDAAGRTVSQTVGVEVERPAAPKTGVAALPRFVPAYQPLEVVSTADEVVATALLVPKPGDGRRIRFLVRDGKAQVQLAPGWYTLRAGEERAEVFLYGGKEDPLSFRDPPAEGERRSEWVDLTDYNSEEEGAPRNSWQQRPDAQVLALFDRQHAAVGDKLAVLVYVPFRRARLLFTMEGASITDYFTTWTPDEPGCYHRIEIPITRRHLPNVYLRARIVAATGPEEPRDAGAKRMEEIERKRLLDEPGDDPRWCRIDVVDPKARPGVEQLNVRVEMDKTDYAPGSEVNVRLRVTDRAGRPRSAEVSLGAVDASVYTFGADAVDGLARLFADPHPPQRFFPKSWRDGRGDRWDEKKQWQEQLAKLSREKAALAALESKVLSKPEQETAAVAPLANGPVLPAGELPIAALPLDRLRTDFRETAVWQPQLRTDADGLARTSFKLPDSLTRYRLTAVALTKETEIGVGRTNLRTTLPLAVQLTLPRFAVTQDQLTAVGLVHNQGAADRTCTVTWEVAGAKVDGLAGAGNDLDGWKTEVVDGKTVGRGKVSIPAGKSVRVGLILVADRVGTARVVFRAADADAADAEVRELPVQPIGRPREVAFDGVFSGKRRFELPAGFLARDLHICIARSEVVRSLDGLGYLVEYPYGCVEQTMSRFLPAVMVKEATRHAPVQLPAPVSEKLPQVLAQGLARLYHFQHADGGWGWWERDATNPRMSIYVVYGLARCRLTGAEVDAAVLSRGCRYLQQQLADNQLDASLAAEAWRALALAGQADADRLEAHARRALAPAAAPEVLCNLALACRQAGRLETSQRLWTAARAWKPPGVEELALQLTARIEFGESYEDCQATANLLLAARHGLIWDTTRATSAAIDGLSRMLGYAVAKAQARSLKVTVGGQTVLNLTDGADLKQLVYRVHLSAEKLPAQEALAIELNGEADGDLAYTIAATGVQRQDELGPLGEGVKLIRRLETVDGKALEGPLQVGQVVAVRLWLDLAAPQNYLIVEDRRPSGCEFADDKIVGPTAGAAAHVEFRDDRVCTFFTHFPAGRHEIVYYLRAETPGFSTMLPGCAYPMYAPDRRGETGAVRLEIRGP